MGEPEAPQELPDWAPPFVALSRDAPVYVALPAAELLRNLAGAGRSDRYSLFLLCGVVESIVRFLAIAGIAELTMANKGVLPPRLAPSLRNIIDTPHFGTWRSILDHVVRVARRPLGLLPEIQAARDAIGTLLRGDREDDQANLIGVRNALAHDSLGQEARCEILLGKWGPDVGAVVRRLGWLGEIEVWTRTSEGLRRLNGPDPGGTDAAPPAQLGPVEVGAVVLTRGDVIVPVEPFGRYGPSRASTKEVPQVFIRRDYDRGALVFSLAGSRDALQAYETAALYRRFTELFSLDPAVAKREFRERDFDVEVNAASRSFEGRADDMAAMLAAIRETPGGLLWLQGVAGSGKSFLMARAASELATAAEVQAAVAGAAGEGPAEQILIYRFHARNGRASERQFLSWLVERLDLKRGQSGLLEAEQNPDLASGTDRLRALAAELIGADRGRRIVLFMDGLDELERREPGASQTILEALVPVARNTLFVVSGQPTHRLPELMGRLGGRTLFGGSLRGMTRQELRAILDHRLPEAIKRIVAQDTDGAGTRNVFIERLLDASMGQPSYLTGLIKEIDEGRFQNFDPSEADLLRPIGAIVDAALKPLGDREGGYYSLWAACFLALEREPLSMEALAALIGRATGETSRALDLTLRALDRLGGIVSRAPDGGGFILADGAIEQRVIDSADNAPILAKARALLVAAALAPGDDAATPYLMRYGIAELLEAGRAADAAGLLSDAGYLGRRLSLDGRGGATRIRADWSAVLAAGVALDETQQAWQQFWATDGARLAVDDDGDRCRSFIECGLTYAPGTVVGGAVRGLRDSPERPLLLPETGYRRQDRISAVLHGHTAKIKGVIELSNGVLLSWDGDNALLFWDKTGASVKAARRFAKWSGGAFELSTGVVCAYSSKTLEFWTLDGERIGEPITVPGITGAFQLSGRPMILAWSSHSAEAALRLLTLDGEVLRSMPVPAALPPREWQCLSGAAELADGRLLLWNANRAIVCDLDGNVVDSLSELGMQIDSIVPLSSGGAAVLYTPETGGSQASLWRPGRKPASLSAGLHCYGVYETPDLRILAFGSQHGRFFDQDGTPLGPAKETSLEWMRMMPDGTIVGFVRRRHIDWAEEHLVVADTDLETVKDSYEWKWATRPEDAIVLRDGRILFWTGPTMQIWDIGRKAAGFLRRLADDATVRGSQKWARLADGARAAVTRANRLARGDLAAAAPVVEATKSELGRVGGILMGVFAPGKAARDDLARESEGAADVAKRLGGRAWAGARAVWGGEASPSQRIIAKRPDAWRLGRTRDLDSGRFVTFGSEYGSYQQLWSPYGEPLDTFGGYDVIGIQPLPGETLLTWTGRGAFTRWRVDTESGRPRVLQDGDVIEAHNGMEGGFARLSDERFLSGGRDGRLRFWTKDGRPSSEPWDAHSGPIVGVGCLSDGRLVSWSSNGELKVWSPDGAFIRRHLIWSATLGVAAGELMLGTEDLLVRCTVV